jgi:hypothetical protein
MTVRAFVLALPCLFGCAAPPASPAPIAVLYLLDKSDDLREGFEHLKKGCVAGAATLQQADYVGVLAFDTFPKWAVKFTHPGEGKLAALGAVQAGGGSELHHALREAGRAFASLPSDPPLRKRLIVISAGSTSREGLEHLVRRLAKDGVILSTLLISSAQSDAVLMSELATWGRGRMYFANKPAIVPGMLIQETRHQ